MYHFNTPSTLRACHRINLDHKCIGLVQKILAKALSSFPAFLLIATCWSLPRSRLYSRTLKSWLRLHPLLQGRQKTKGHMRTLMHKPGSWSCTSPLQAKCVRLVLPVSVPDSGALLAKVSWSLCTFPLDTKWHVTSLIRQRPMILWPNELLSQLHCIWRSVASLCCLLQ